jgi:hypothetical protein
LQIIDGDKSSKERDFNTAFPTELLLPLAMIELHGKE